MTLDTDKFIIEIEKRRELWDISSLNYANKIVKQNSWFEVCQIFHEKFDEMPATKQNEILKDIQRKWKSLRNSFAREQSRRKNIKSGSSQSSWKTYVYFNQLSFLGSCTANRPTTSNVSPIHCDDNELDTEKCNDDTDHTFESVEESHPATNQRSTKKTKLNRNESEDHLFETIAKSLEFRNQMEKEAMEDQDRLFLLSLVDDLKKVPPHLKMQVKSNIINAISSGLTFQQPIINFDPRCQLNPPYNFQTSAFIQRPFLQPTTSTAQQQPLSTFQETFPSQYTKYVSNVHHTNHNINYTTTDTSSTSSNSQNSSLDVGSSQSSNLNLVNFLNDYTSHDA